MKYILSYIRNRLEKNKNAIIVINGPTGSGKSYSALTIADACARLFGTNFKINDNVAFDFGDLVRKSRQMENLAPGTPFVFEEVGAVGGGASALDWQSKLNRFFVSFMQTTRHKNQILIFTCPDFNYLMLGARKLVHMQIETKFINHRAKFCQVKPFCLQVNQRIGKIYYKFMRVKENNRVKMIPTQNIPKPSPYLIEEYEKLKKKYSDKLESSIILDEDNSIMKQKTPNRVNPLITVALKEKSHLSYAKISKMLNIDIRTAERHVFRAKKAEKVAHSCHNTAKTLAIADAGTNTAP